MFFAQHKGYLNCQGEGCEKYVLGAGKQGVIKNQHFTKFWGLEAKEQVLCGGCLGKYRDLMPKRKKYTYNDYEKRGYWDWRNKG